MLYYYLISLVVECIYHIGTIFLCLTISLQNSENYVNTVGAPAEVVCQKDIISGGGFSIYYKQPSFQKTHVANYFAQYTPRAGYNATGRGYPDISMAGRKYYTVNGNKTGLVSGTSLAAPVAAAFFSNVNAARYAVGKGSVGWINPTLYANYASFTNDVTSGNNSYKLNNGTYCTHGFEAVTGWDPASGLGSLNYGKFEALLVSLGTVNALSSTEAPTEAPTQAPTAAPSATAASQAVIELEGKALFAMASAIPLLQTVTYGE
jgi:subtilase family serine protease